MENEKVILAYSGGLDTSCILKWLLDKKFNVICYLADIGQEEDLEAAKKKALLIGASCVEIDYLRNTFVTDYVWPAIQGGLLYESRYLLGTSLARPCISVGLVHCAQKYNAKYIAHGATGKGNDQVRFELSCYSLNPDIKIIAPWRIQEFFDRFRGRQDLLKYAEKHNIQVVATPKAPWSTDANLLHVSYESGILENPCNEAPSNLFNITKNLTETPDKSDLIQIHFKEGLPEAVFFNQNKIFGDPCGLLTYLNEIGGKHGIGRIDIVENRYIGLKSRGLYETPGGSILHVAHTDLEVFCLDREVLRIKQYLRDRLSDCIYNGFWFSPEGSYLRNCISEAEKPVTGFVNLELFKGNVRVLGRYSEHSLYNEDLVSMDKNSDFSPNEATGFINIQAIRLKEYNRYIKNHKFDRNK